MKGITAAGSAPRERQVVRAEDQLAAITALGRALAEGQALQDTLAQIARAAAWLVNAQASAIILRAGESEGGLAVAGSYGLSPQYADYLNEVQPLELGHGPSGLAAQRAEPVCISDVFDDPVFEPWRTLALREHYRAMVSVPLRLEGERVIGVLNTYRGETGPWASEEVALLSSLADHAAIAIRVAQLLDESRRQVQGLSLIVRSLRAQAHEHSNRLHAIYGLLALGEAEQARRLVAGVEDRYHTVYGRVTAGIENPTVAGFLVAECMAAVVSGITIHVDRRSRLRELPPALGELDAVTVLGNLLHNAVDAVSEMPPSRRRVSVRLSQTPAQTLFTVRDWGPGLDPDAVARIFERDYSTKPEHAGIGLALVRSIVSRARGRIDVSLPPGGGLAVTVTIPS